MSLFGTSTKEPSSSAPSGNQSSKGLFADDKPATQHGSSLFDEEDEEATEDSPWSMPTPKKAARGDPIKNLIPASAAPDSYINAFDAILESGNSVNGKITSAGVNTMLENSSIPKNDRVSILKLVAPQGLPEDGLDRPTFNVLLALIGLAQEGEDVTLDSVDERKKSMSVNGGCEYQLTYIQTSHSQHYHIFPSSNQTTYQQ